ncbi:hypothetical protein EGR_11305 [Echinococcus granulosus]|uniref:Uncharacterized protein n=1 Tax=Echinococcus granulosus TaxID=6210 RepID=W6UK07_ECHGR|nr:hypothetical protein EGR_11305 [Echinococcus granulosus]EUB53844.1 hypothetical protein EGR_11305 [Echinococcus granulosus]
MHLEISNLEMLTPINSCKLELPPETIRIVPSQKDASFIFRGGFHSETSDQSAFNLQYYFKIPTRVLVLPSKFQFCFCNLRIVKNATWPEFFVLAILGYEVFSVNVAANYNQVTPYITERF